MTENDALRIFKSIRLYFKGSYDINKYGLLGVKVSEKEYHKYHYFLKKAKRIFNKTEFIQFVVANIINDVQFDDMIQINDYSLRTYREWKKRNDRFTNEVNNDIISIKDEFLIPYHLEFNDLFMTNGNHPPILKMLLGNDINSETFIAFNEVLHFYDDFDIKLKNDFIWEETRDKMLRYKIFLKIDKNKIKDLLKDAYITK